MNINPAILFAQGADATIAPLVYTKLATFRQMTKLKNLFIHEKHEIH